MGLFACPFCRELFPEGEHVTCPVCGVVLSSFDKLPPSALHEADEDDVPLAPEHERFAASYLGRGRGLLPALALVGLALFFAPWIRLTLPEVVDLTGFDLSRRLGWSWGGAVAWVVLVPTVLSRRTIAQLRGARVAACFLGAVPAITAAIFLLRPPHGGLLPLRFTFAWPLSGTIVLSSLALLVALRLGGALDDVVVRRGSSRGHAVH